MPRLNIIIASTRPGRVGEQVGAWFARVAREHGGFDVHVIDLASLDLPLLNEPAPAIEAEQYQHEHTREWSSLTDAADAFVIVTPEYNHGYPAPIKNALDYLFTEWRDKPVGFVSYGMTSGGMRAVQQLKSVVTALGMMPIPNGVVVHLRDMLDASGTFVPTAQTLAAGKALLTELLRLTPALAALRASK
jgi:NAD(P)H-dependent FMN reductase